MLKRSYQFLGSLDLGIWLTAGVSILLAAGSFTDSASEAGGINDLPLVVWLKEAPPGNSWWLWGAIALLVILALNAVICSIEALRTRLGKGNIWAILAPQAMHLGFLLIMVAHLLSATGGMKQVLQVGEGSSIGFPDGSIVTVGAITAEPGPMGMPSDFSTQFNYDISGVRKSAVAAPNRPFFYKGFGIYVKDVGMMEMPAALVEIHREPGAGFALAGALLFTVGNVVVLAFRRGRRE